MIISSVMLGGLEVSSQRQDMCLISVDIHCNMTHVLPSRRRYRFQWRVEDLVLQTGGYDADCIDEGIAI